MPKSAKSFRKNLQKSGVFFTPKKLAEYMRSFFPSDVAEIYDPTCGDGGKHWGNDEYGNTDSVSVRFAI